MYTLRKKIIIALAITTTAVGSWAFSSSSQYFEVSKNLEIFATLYKELNIYYVDDIDPAQTMKTGIDAMLSSLDPYTNYISEADIETYRLQTTGKYGGIGALIRQGEGHVMVAEPYFGYAADKAGLKAGDVILEVDGQSTAERNTEEVSKILKGQPKSKVELLVKRPNADGSYGEPYIVKVEREEIKINNVPYFGMADESQGIGYIKLSNFTDKAGHEVAKAFKSLKEEHELKGIILDLRGNPGGLLLEAVNVSNVFLPKGKEICFTKGKNPEWDDSYKSLNDPVDLKLPVAVLTNGASASASEIVSGAIQDYDRGIVVGRKTFGKGLVQTTRPLTYNTQLKVTSAKYYIPSGRCIQSINYNERDALGRPLKMPDSLKSTFKTEAGRLVYDGGGVDPDVQIEQRTLSNIAQALLREDLLFEFATRFAAKTPSIAGPREFTIDDALYEELLAFLATKEYDYTTSSEKLIEELQEAAQEESYYEAIESQLSALKTDIQHDKDKDLIKHKAEIKRLLASEIVVRYHYQKGRIQQNFVEDQDLQAAVTHLTQQDKYAALLSPQ